VNQFTNPSTRESHQIIKCLTHQKVNQVELVNNFLAQLTVNQSIWTKL